MPEAYPVVDVSQWEVTGVQSDGLGEHPWLREPTSRELWLFKLVTEHRGFIRGEDWAEKIAREIAVALAVPCAEVQLAVDGPRHGSLSKDLCPRGWEMQPGALLLADVFPNYEPALKGAPGHSLEAIRQALTGIAPPPSFVASSLQAFDVFVGFLVLDSLVANRDRHEQNWAVLRPPTDVDAPDALCATYDHGSSLGFNLDDEQRLHIMRRSLTRWAERGTAYRFEHGSDGPVTLVELARQGLDWCEAEVRAQWLAAVERLDPATIAGLVRRVPGMSEATATFVIELITINRRRLLDA